MQPPRPRQESLIDITFHLDANDILHVSAVDKKTGAQQTVTIKDSTNLDRETVERLRREAQRSQQEDRAQVRKIRRRQQLNAYLEEVHKRLDSVGSRDANNKFIQKTGEYAQRLQRALAGLDDAAVEQAARDLDAVWQKLLAVLPAGTAEAARKEQPAGAAEAAAERPDPEATVNCAHCGARLSPGFAFCGKCGMPLKAQACGKCGAALVEGFSFCGRCGAKVT